MRFCPKCSKPQRWGGPRQNSAGKNVDVYVCEDGHEEEVQR
jgi:hypothetical protein